MFCKLIFVLENKFLQQFLTFHSNNHTKKGNHINFSIKIVKNFNKCMNFIFIQINQIILIYKKYYYFLWKYLKTIEYFLTL